MPSRPMVEMDWRAVAFTLGLAWNAMPRPARLSIGRVVGAVADRHRLGDVDLLELAQQAQQLGLAAPVDHLADIAPRELALLDLQLVGIYVVESVFLAQVVAEIGEPAREDRRFIAHALEDRHHALQPLR